MGLLSREPNVERLWRRGDVERLCRAALWRDQVPGPDGRLVDVGVPVRYRAVAALSRFDEPAARGAIRDALSDDADSVRLIAIQGVGAARDRDSIRPLARVALDGASPRVRRAALETLVELEPGEGALEFAAAVTNGGGHAVTADDGDDVRRLLDASGGDGRWVAGLLSIALAWGDEDVAGRAEQLVSRLPGLPIDPFVSALEVTSRRALVARALGYLHDVRALEPLLELVDDPDPSTRRDVVWALGELKHPRAVDALLRSTADPEYAVREAAISALDRLGTVAIVMGARSLVGKFLHSGGQEHAGMPPAVRARLSGLADQLVRRVRAGRPDALELEPPADAPPADSDPPP
jgi:hypothetical protein